MMAKVSCTHHHQDLMIEMLDEVQHRKSKLLSASLLTVETEYRSPLYSPTVIPARKIVMCWRTRLHWRRETLGVKARVSQLDLTSQNCQHREITAIPTM